MHTDVGGLYGCPVDLRSAVVQAIVPVLQRHCQHSLVTYLARALKMRIPRQQTTQIAGGDGDRRVTACEMYDNRGILTNERNQNPETLAEV